ncbi:MAG: UDP-3-O-acylglucosamine N-acyltransferase [Acidobacteriota bacterium]
MRRTLGELAAAVGGRVIGDGARPIEGIRTLETARATDLSFLTGARYLEAARASRAGAILVARETDGLAADQLLVAQPSVALARLLELFHPVVPVAPGIHPTAVVAGDAEIAADAEVGPYAVIGAGARIGPRATIGAHVVIGEGCVVGDGSVLHPHVVLYRRTRLGARVEVHAGVVLGADGFGYATDRGVHHKIPQVGDVEIGDDVEIGALTAIDRALLGTTRVGAGTKIDNLVQVGHNVEIGPASMLCGQAGVAGSARLGAGVVLAGQVGVAGHLTVGDGVQVASKSAVYDSVQPGVAVAGVPAGPIGRWRRQQALLRRLEGLFRRVRELERRAGLGRTETESEGEGGS